MADSMSDFGVHVQDEWVATVLRSRCDTRAADMSRKKTGTSKYLSMSEGEKQRFLLQREIVQNRHTNVLYNAFLQSYRF